MIYSHEKPFSKSTIILETNAFFMIVNLFSPRLDLAIGMTNKLINAKMQISKYIKNLLNILIPSNKNPQKLLIYLA